MAVTKNATSAKKATFEDTPSRVCVLGTHIGESLILRSNPSDELVRGFVKEHLRRYHAGEPGGPSRMPAYKILSATYYESEIAFREGRGKQDEIDISDLDPMA